MKLIDRKSGDVLERRGRNGELQQVQVLRAGERKGQRFVDVETFHKLKLTGKVFRVFADDDPTTIPFAAEDWEEYE